MNRKIGLARIDAFVQLFLLLSWLIFVFVGGLVWGYFIVGAYQLFSIAVHRAMKFNRRSNRKYYEIIGIGLLIYWVITGTLILFASNNFHGDFIETVSYPVYYMALFQLMTTPILAIFYMVFCFRESYQVKKI